MYIQSECNSICKEYSKMIKQNSKNTTKIWSYIFIGFLVVMAVITQIPNLLDDGAAWILYYIYGGIVFTGLTVALLISVFSISEKPAFNYLYKEIYNKLNQERGTFYEYIPYEKEKFEFNNRGGLFTRHCRTHIRRHVSGTSPNSNKFDIFDVTLISGSGKSQHTHFQGIYFFTSRSSSTFFQIRSHTRPNLKGIRYMRILEQEELKVYIEEGKSIANTEYKYIETVKRLKRNLKAKRIYLSVTNDEIHFAYVPTVQIRKQQNLSINKMNELYQTFLDEVKVIDELVESTEF